MKKLQNRKGFTLVELLIVMAIIGILVLVAVPRFTKATEMSKIRTVQANTRTIASAAGLYVADNNGTAPTNIGELVTAEYLAADLNGKPAGATYAISGTEVKGSITLTNDVAVTIDGASISSDKKTVEFIVKFQ